MSARQPSPGLHQREPRQVEAASSLPRIAAGARGYWHRRSTGWIGGWTPMSDNVKQEQDPGSNTVKDPADWVTGDEPATGAQRSYLRTLAEEAHEEVPAELS